MAWRIHAAELSSYILGAALVILAADHLSQVFRISPETKFLLSPTVVTAPAVNRALKGDRLAIQIVKPVDKDKAISWLDLPIGCEFVVSPLVGDIQDASLPMRCVS